MYCTFKAALMCNVQNPCLNLLLTVLIDKFQRRPPGFSSQNAVRRYSPDSWRIFCQEEHSGRPVQFRRQASLTVLYRIGFQLRTATPIFFQGHAPLHAHLQKSRNDPKTTGPLVYTKSSVGSMTKLCHFHQRCQQNSIYKLAQTCLPGVPKCESTIRDALIWSAAADTSQDAYHFCLY